MNTEILTGKYLMHRMMRRAQGLSENTLYDWLWGSYPMESTAEVSRCLWSIANNLESMGLVFVERSSGVWGWEEASVSNSKKGETP